MIHATLIALSLLAQTQCALRVPMTNENGDELILYVAGDRTSYAVPGSDGMIWFEGGAIQSGAAFAASFGYNFTISLDLDRCTAGQAWETHSWHGDALTFTCASSAGIEESIPAPFADVPSALFVQSASLPHTTVFTANGDLLGLWWSDDIPNATPPRRGAWVAPSGGVSLSRFLAAIAGDQHCANETPAAVMPWPGAGEPRPGRT